jgi:hypothetical protein
MRTQNQRGNNGDHVVARVSRMRTDRDGLERVIGASTVHGAQREVHGGRRRGNSALSKRAVAADCTSGTHAPAARITFLIPPAPAGLRHPGRRPCPRAYSLGLALGGLSQPVTLKAPRPIQRAARSSSSTT